MWKKLAIFLLVLLVAAVGVVVYLCLRAEIAHAGGAVDEARALLDEALALAREQGARALELRLGGTLVALFPGDPAQRARAAEIVARLTGEVDPGELAALAAACSA